MKTVYLILAIALVARTAPCASASDLSNAPPSFKYEDRTIVPMDIDQYELRYEIGVKERAVVGHARISFRTGEKGRPFFDLLTEPTRIFLDEKPVKKAPEIPAPGFPTTLRYADQLIEAGQHVMEIDFPVERVWFPKGELKFGWFMTDLRERGFLERYAPANLEFDQFKMTVTAEVSGTEKKILFFTNGKAEQLGRSKFRVEYPAFYAASSFYFHITTDDLSVLKDTHNGIEKTIPVTVYGDDAAKNKEALAEIHTVVSELEKDYGAYPHEKLLVYIDEDYPGMEHCGAARSSVESLDHELMHSWFGRGVLPRDGNAGWIDEGIVRWHDRGYPKNASIQDIEVHAQLSGFPGYRRSTAMFSYGQGADIMAMMDSLLPAGLKPVLSDLFKGRRYTTLSNAEFQTFLEKKTPLPIQDIFNRFILGDFKLKDAG